MVKLADKPVAKEIIELLLLQSRVSKSREDFGRLQPGADGRIRTVMSPGGTWTGRLSHAGTFLEASTNLANLSYKYGRLDDLYNIRKVIACDRGRMLVEIDYSQAEARLAAYWSRDPLAIKQYEEGIDRYRFFAAQFYGIDEADVSKDQRNCGKMMILALERGVGWSKLQEQVNEWGDLTGLSITAAEAKRGEALFHRIYRRLKPWWTEVLDEVTGKGYLINPFGRRVDFFNRVDSEAAREKIKRDAVSYLVQSTVAHMTNQSIIDVYEAGEPHGIRLLLQLHDALIFDVPLRSWRAGASIVRNIMEDNGVVLLHDEEVRIPVEVAVSSKSWADVKEVVL